MSGSAPERRLGYIDGLRAVAVLSVLAFHVRVHTAGVSLEHFFKECSHGVDLFFVLSGLCLAAPTLERIRQSGSTAFDVAGYAVKRCLRILPPYVAAVAIFAAAVGLATARGIPLPDGMHHFDATGLLSELFFLDRSNEHINQSFWSLAIEFRWYFVFPFALALWVARPRALLLAIGLVIVAAECTRASSVDLGILDAFLLGIVAAQVRVSDHPIAKYGPAFIAGGVLLGLVLEPAYHFPIQTNSGWHIAAFGLVIYAGRAVWLQRLLSTRILRAIGVASYSIYLVHEPIVSFFAARATPQTIAVAYAAAAGGALLAGAALWWLVERPITDPALVKRVLRATRDELAATLERWHVPAVLELNSGAQQRLARAARAATAPRAAAPPAEPSPPAAPASTARSG